MRRIDLSGRPYNSICFNCQLGDETIISSELKNEAMLLSEAGVNFLLLETTFLNEKIVNYNILGQLQIEELGDTRYEGWFDKENLENLEIELRCN